MYETAKSLDEQCKAAMQERAATTSFRAQITQPERLKARALFAKLCVDYPAYALEKKVEHKLWMLHYRSIAPELQAAAAVKTNAKSVGGNSAMHYSSERLQLLLDDCTAFFRELFAALRKSSVNFASKLGTATAAVNQGSSDAESQRRARREVDRMAISVSSLRQLLAFAATSLGDLARYQAMHVVGADSVGAPTSVSDGYTAAAELYLRAFLLYPSSGKPMNQLAVIASHLGNDFDAVYYYTRAVSALEPFPARENLLTLSEKNRKLMAALGVGVADSSSEYGAASRGTVSSNSLLRSSDLTAQLQAVPTAGPERDLYMFKAELVRLHGMLITHIGLESYDAVLSSCVANLRKCVSVHGTIGSYLLAQSLVLCLHAVTTFLPASFQPHADQRTPSASPSNSALWRQPMLIKAFGFLFSVFDAILRSCAADLTTLPFLDCLAVLCTWLWALETEHLAALEPPTNVPGIAVPISVSQSLLHAVDDASDSFRVRLARLVNAVTFELSSALSSSDLDATDSKISDTDSSASQWLPLSDLNDRAFILTAATTPVTLLGGFAPLESCKLWREQKSMLIHSRSAQLQAVRNMGNLLYYDSDNLRFSAFPLVASTITTTSSSDSSATTPLDVSNTDVSASDPTQAPEPGQPAQPLPAVSEPVESQLAQASTESAKPPAEERKLDFDMAADMSDLSFTDQPLHSASHAAASDRETVIPTSSSAPTASARAGMLVVPGLDFQALAKEAEKRKAAAAEMEKVRTVQYRFCLWSGCFCCLIADFYRYHSTKLSCVHVTAVCVLSVGTRESRAATEVDGCGSRRSSRGGKAAGDLGRAQHLHVARSAEGILNEGHSDRNRFLAQQGLSGMLRMQSGRCLHQFLHCLYHLIFVDHWPENVCRCPRFWRSCPATT